MLRGRINIPYFTRNINSVIANQNMEFPSKQPVGHTGQKYDDDDPHLARFINRVKQTNPNHAIKLVAEEPVEKVASRKVWCDGGHPAVGHPRVFINLDKEGPHVCGYCGKQFIKS